MKLLWTDLETTGLDPQRDTILEIAVFEADLSAPFDARLIFHQTPYFPASRREGLSEFILKMHTDNGLLAECADVSNPILAKCLHRLSDLVGPPPKDREDLPVLAGSSVHFDHAFLRAHHQALGAVQLSHRHYDVSAIKLFCQSLGMPKLPKAEAHRAKDDVLESIAHAKHCLEWLRSRGFTA